jgi:MFS family permease
MTAVVPETAKAEWKAHWRVAVAAMVGVSLSALPAFGLGLFIHPLEQEFGWSRAGISLGMTITTGVGTLFAWLAGAVADRVGARRMALSGAALFCLSYALLSQVTADIRTWWACWLLISISLLAMQATIWSKAVSSCFDKGRGVALALMASGTGVSTIFLPTLGNLAIASYGWRMAFVVIGAVHAVVVLPLLWLWFFEATDRAPGATRQRRAELQQALPGWTVREGLRRRQTYQIAVAAMLAGMAVTGYSVHIVSMLTDKGIPRGEAAGMLSVLGLLAVVSRLVIGRIFDRVASPLVGIISVSLPVIPGLVMLLLPPTPLAGLLAAASVGLAIGGEYDTVLYLSSRFFGRKAFGTLFGVVATIMTAGFGLGPLLAGRIYDTTGSYQLYFIGAIPATLICVVMIATLGPYPDHAPDDGRAAHPA